MYLIVTRAFPPELGGMQSLMWGLTKEMSKNFLIKVFADYQENHKEFDKNENFSIERVGGIKFLRKIRKAQLVNEFLKENNAKCTNVPYKFNRAVLFNSAYFHETDEIDFKDEYEGRRINMTYLFGRRLVKSKN